MAKTKTDVRKDVKKVVEYLWYDEETNWNECGRMKSGHIFNVLERLNERFKLGFKRDPDFEEGGDDE